MPVGTENIDQQTKCTVYEWLTCVLIAKILKYDGKQCYLIIYMVRINLSICGVDSPDRSVDVPLRYEVKYLHDIMFLKYILILKTFPVLSKV